MGAWSLLILAGVFEIGFTTCMKLSNGFTHVLYTTGFIIFAALSFWCLSKTLSHIPLGTAYAVWTGIGALGTAVVGIAFFGDPSSILRVFFLLLLVASIVGLKLVGYHTAL